MSGFGGIIISGASDQFKPNFTPIVKENKTRSAKPKTKKVKTPTIQKKKPTKKTNKTNKKNISRLAVKATYLKKNRKLPTNAKLAF